MVGDILQRLPDDWELRKLSDVSLIIDSLHKTPAYTTIGYPMVRVTDVKGGFLDLADALRVDEDIFKEFTRRHMPRRGNIIFSRVGTYGNASYVKTNLPFCLGQNTALIVPRINSRFLHICLQSSVVRNQIECSVVGSTQKTISLKSISTLLIPIPPQPELEAIAHILGTLDDKIELNRRLNETLEAMARAIFQSWFVDFDPVRDKAAGRQPEGMDAATAALFPDSFQNSPLGKIPKGWRVGNIGDIASNRRIGVDPSQLEPGTPYIGLEHMPRKSIALFEWGQADGVESNKFRFSEGDILFGKLRPYFHKVGVAPLDGVCSTDILVILPTKPHYFALTLAQVSSEDLIQYVEAASTGTKMPRTNWHDITRYEIVIPDENVMKKFDETIRPMTDSIKANIHESRTLAAIRDALLLKLLSGEVRVANKEKFIEEASK